LLCFRFHILRLYLATKDFVDQLFEVIGNGRYIPEAKKVKFTCLSFI